MTQKSFSISLLSRFHFSLELLEYLSKGGKVLKTHFVGPNIVTKKADWARNIIIFMRCLQAQLENDFGAVIFVIELFE